MLREDSKKRLFRQDTGEMIQEREMTEDDFQESLFENDEQRAIYSPIIKHSDHRDD